ncbi:hypothetical protein PIB30_097126 [Stylosanthes scabra]|uniref:CCHC-type domain-containing protein n=1 Tax=Stylosanthes scabra TaxID=79078 RepID=A0ABU6RX23_9FABA|nr:hypothetical protein [Stylosanthes scabra]
MSFVPELSCFPIDLLGMPCVHAVAAISKVRVKPVEEFVTPFLTMDAIRVTYDIHVNPVNSEEFWYPTAGEKPTAPRIIRPPGLPRKKRTEAARPPPAPINGDKVRRTFQVTCSKCGEKGHYYKTCKGAPQRKYWQPKRKKAKAKARRQKKKMPKKPHVPTDPREEIPISQSAPPTVGDAAEANSQPQAPTTFVIPVPPPMPKTLQPLRPKQRIFRPQAFLSDVRFSTHPAQPPQQQPPIPQVQPPVMPSTSNSEATSQGTPAAAPGATPEGLFNFMPTPIDKPPTQE